MEQNHDFEVYVVIIEKKFGSIHRNSSSVFSDIHESLRDK